MEHSEFLEKYKNNEIIINIDKNKAGLFFSKPGLMPNHLRQKQSLIRTLAFLGSIGGIVPRRF